MIQYSLMKAHCEGRSIFEGDVKKVSGITAYVQKGP
jgi:hypothetical protein